MMKKSTQNTGVLRRFLLPVASLCLGLVVFAGTASLADKDESVLPGVPVASGESDSASGTTTSLTEYLAKHEQDSGRERKLAPTAGLPSQDSTDPGAVELDGEDRVMHIGRVMSSTPVPSSGNAAASRAEGGLALGVECDCDQECDGAAPGADACNIVQCIVRSVCSEDDGVPCLLGSAVCVDAGAGSCETDAFGCESNVPPDCNFVQRCAIVQLIDWPCDADEDFCTADLCEDDDGTCSVSGDPCDPNNGDDDCPHT